MSRWRSFSGELARELLKEWIDRIHAVSESLNFAPGELINIQFLRYVHYTAVAELVSRRYVQDGIRARVVEFGGSNEVIKNFFGDVDYEIAPNWPDVDVQCLECYSDESYDVVVIDNVLEHVPSPQLAVSEIHRILKNGGVCICTTPFLIRIHDYPGDYWRFAEDGLKELFGAYSKVEVDGWGNRFTLKTILRYGWVSARNAKRLFRIALWNEAEWPITYLTIAMK